MPYVHLNVSSQLTEQEIIKLREGIAEIMPALPGKNRDNSMIHIDASCALSMGDPEQPCAFLEVRLYRASPEQNKKDFVEKAAAMLTSRTGIPAERIYVNIIELNEWGVGSRFF